MEILKKLLGLMIRYDRWLLVIAVVLIIATSVLTVSQAELGQAFFSVVKNIDRNTNKNAPATGTGITAFTSAIKTFLEKKTIDDKIEYLVQLYSIKMLLILAIFVILFYLLFEIIMYFKNYLNSYLAYNASIMMQKELFEKLLRLPSLYFKSTAKTGDLISRLMSDINTIRGSIQELLEYLFFTPILLVMSMYMLVRKSLLFTCIILVCGTLAILLINIISKVIKNLVYEAQKKSADTSDYINQTIYGIDVIKIYNREKDSTDAFHAVIKRYKNSLVRLLSYVLITKPLIEMVGAIILVVILISGIFLIWKGIIKLDTIIGFIMYLLVLSPSIQGLGRILTSLRSAEGAAMRIKEIQILDEENSKFGSEQLDSFKGEIVYDCVTFSYATILESSHIRESFEITDESAVIKELTMSIHAGEFIAIVGPSGSGKTTVVNLLAALIHPTSGKILFDGKDYRSYRIEDIRRQIAYVTQETVLFPVSVYDNIAFGNPAATREDVYEAAKMANADGFINNLPKQYETVLGERGAKISGGEKQRIAIARALIKKPKILVFDEATSSLDSNSEKSIQDAISRIIHQHTLIVIAHRLSTVTNADRIVVMEAGSIKEVGTHDDLIASKGLYAELYRKQFGE